jgi:rare lipoprotein A
MTDRRRSSLLLVLGLLAGCAGHKAAPSAMEGSGSEGTYKIGFPYNIDGVWYYPQVDYAYDQTGVASWYGEDFHGKYTANGEIFDQNALTAAHPTLPMPSVVEVTNLENGRSLRLRVNDRGPYVANRIVDVSREAARRLGFEGEGTAKVRVKILVPESMQVAMAAKRNGGDVGVAAAAPLAAPRIPVAAAALPAAPSAAGVHLAAADVVAPPPAPAALPTTGASVPRQGRQIFIQAGAYARVENATKVQMRLGSLGRVMVEMAKAGGADIYRVRLGPFATRADAGKLLGSVVGAGFSDARVIED